VGVRPFYFRPITATKHVESTFCTLSGREFDSPRLHHFQVMNGIMKLIRLVIIVSLLFSQQLNAQITDTLGINAELRIDSREKGMIDGAYIYATNLNTYEAKGVKSSKGKAILYLQLNHLYLVEVSHPGFYKKSIHIETKVGKKDIVNSQIEIDIILKKNCENDTAIGVIMEQAMGRVVYNKSSGKFEYDLKFTNKMEALYEEMRIKRCELADKVRKAQKLAVDMGDSAKMATKQAEITAEMNQLAIDIALFEEGIKKYGDKDLESKNIVAFKPEEEKPKEDSVIIAAMIISDTATKDTVIMSQASDTNIIDSEKTEKFDEKQPRIFIFPRHGWPSELANYLKGSDYTGMPIGTYTYDLTKSRTSIYIEDADELRKKFPIEFDQAFKNWDYIVKMNTPNNEP